MVKREIESDVKLEDITEAIQSLKLLANAINTSNGNKKVIVKEISSFEFNNINKIEELEKSVKNAEFSDKMMLDSIELSIRDFLKKKLDNIYVSDSEIDNFVGFMMSIKKSITDNSSNFNNYLSECYFERFNDEELDKLNDILDELREKRRYIR